MQPLVARLAAAPPLDIENMPALDAAIHLTLALSTNVEPYAPALLSAALQIAAAALAASGGGEAVTDAAVQAANVATFALDAIAALAETLGRSTPALLQVRAVTQSATCMQSVCLTATGARWDVRACGCLTAAGACLCGGELVICRCCTCDLL